MGLGSPGKTARERLQVVPTPVDPSLYKRVIVKRFANQTDFEALVHGIEAIAGRGNVYRGGTSEAFYVFYARICARPGCRAHPKSGAQYCSERCRERSA